MVMIIVLAVRLLFCWIELTIRARQRRNDNNKDTMAELGNEDVNSAGCEKKAIVDGGPVQPYCSLSGSPR